MYLDVLPCYGQPHAPGQIRQAAKGLLITEVAPAADGLTDEQAVGTQIRKRRKLDLMHFAENQQDQHGGDHTAVNRQSSVPDGDGLLPVEGAVHIAVKFLIEEHIINARSNDPARRRKQHQINDPILLNAIAGGIVIAVDHREHKANGDDDAIPVDRLSKNRKGNSIDMKFQTEARKGNGIHSW